MSGVHLNEIYRRFLAETAWLLLEFNVCHSALKNGDSRLHRLGGEMAVIRLHDAWARFCRELVIRSAGCTPYTATGLRLNRVPGVGRRADVVPQLLSTYPNRRYEPRWHDAVECINAAQRLRITNLATVSGALGATSSPVTDLRHVRNFFAHRWKGTADQIRRRSFFNASMQFNLEDLVGQLVPSGITRMESWIIDMRDIAEAAVQ